MNQAAGNLSALSRLEEGVRLMGIDPGRRNLGLALSDEERIVATPFLQVRREGLAQDLEVIREAVLEHQVGGFVIGLPLLMSGREGRSAQSARAFAESLHKALGLPVAFWDERFSSVAAEKAMRDTRMPPNERQGKEDSIAAAFILQGALDRLSKIS